MRQDVDVAPRDGQPARRLTLRELHSDDDYARCEALQRATWGEDFAEIILAPIMKITQKVGGLAAGAFDESGEMLGLLYGISGVRNGHRAHWSHIMAVREDARNLSIGRHLKLFQREFLLGLDIPTAYWSYDPLVSRNAHLNLNLLGAEPAEYARDLYGPGDNNALHRGLGTDRFIVEWRLRDPRVLAAIDGEVEQPSEWPRAPIVNTDAAGEPVDEFDLPDVDVVRVEIPMDVQAVKEERPQTAVMWRRSTRRALRGYLERGYRVLGLIRADDRSCYALESPSFSRLKESSE